VIGGSRLATKHDKITQTRNGWQTVNADYVGRVAGGNLTLRLPQIPA
jgi:hypothetical protein